MIFRHLTLFFLFIMVAILPACTRHQVEVKPVEIKPIHITIDVNVKVDRALDNFFEDIDEAAYGDKSKSESKSKTN